MGIPVSQITEAIRRAAGGALGAPAGGARNNSPLLERDEQHLLVAWLREQEAAGRLVYDWSAMHKKVTRRPGMPDFTIWKSGRCLLGELKLPGNKLSPEQRRRHDAFLRAGTEVQIWHSAEQAKRLVANWLWVNFREWTLGYEPE